MSGRAKCHHPSMHFDISAVQVPGEREAIAVMRVHCSCCGARFRFVGVDPAGDDFVPFVNRTATEITIPMVEIA